MFDSDDIFPPDACEPRAATLAAEGDGLARQARRLRGAAHELAEEAGLGETQLVGACVEGIFDRAGAGEDLVEVDEGLGTGSRALVD